MEKCDPVDHFQKEQKSAVTLIGELIRWIEGLPTLKDCSEEGLKPAVMLSQNPKALSYSVDGKHVDQSMLTTVQQDQQVKINKKNSLRKLPGVTHQISASTALMVKDEKGKRLRPDTLFAGLKDKQDVELLSAHSRTLYDLVRKNDLPDLNLLLIRIKSKELRVALINGTYKNREEKETPLFLASEIAAHSEGEPRSRALAMVKLFLKQGATLDHRVKEIIAQIDPVLIDKELQSLLIDKSVIFSRS